jgi:hypothetical protein
MWFQTCIHANYEAFEIMTKVATVIVVHFELKHGSWGATSGNSVGAVRAQWELVIHKKPF